MIGIGEGQPEPWAHPTVGNLWLKPPSLTLGATLGGAWQPAEDGPESTQVPSRIVHSSPLVLQPPLIRGGAWNGQPGVVQLDRVGQRWTTLDCPTQKGPDQGISCKSTVQRTFQRPPPAPGQSLEASIYIPTGSVGQ